MTSSVSNNGVSSQNLEVDYSDMPRLEDVSANLIERKIVDLTSLKKGDLSQYLKNEDLSQYFSQIPQDLNHINLTYFRVDSIDSIEPKP